MSYGLLSAWGGVSGKVVVTFSKKTPLLQVLFEPWYLGNMPVFPSAYFIAL